MTDRTDDHDVHGVGDFNNPIYENPPDLVDDVDEIDEAFEAHLEYGTFPTGITNRVTFAAQANDQTIETQATAPPERVSLSQSTFFSGINHDRNMLESTCSESSGSSSSSSSYSLGIGNPNPNRSIGPFSSAPPVNQNSAADSNSRAPFSQNVSQQLRVNQPHSHH